MVNHGSFPFLAESNGILADPTWFRDAYGVMSRVMDGTTADTEYPAPSYTLMSIDAMAGEPAISNAEVVVGSPQAANTSVDDRKAMVAVIEVKGMLSKNVPHWQPYMSNMLVIQRQLIAAANDPMVMGIVLLFDSGGGAVNGTSMLSDTIYQIGRNIKPVYAHVQGLAASAAYWMASQCNGVYLSASTDFVGSIGVVQTHVSLEKAYEMEGIVVTYITPDENDEKVVGAENQSLSERDRELIKSRLVPLLSEFKSSVSRGRGDRCDLTATGITSGNVFMASQAKRMGLCDGIESLERTVLRAYREGVKFSKQRENAETSNNDDMTLTEQLALGLTTPSQIKKDADAQSAAKASAQAPAANATEEEVTMKDLLNAFKEQTALFTQILSQNAAAPATQPPATSDAASVSEGSEETADTPQADAGIDDTAEVEAEEQGAVETSEEIEATESAPVTETEESQEPEAAAQEEAPVEPTPDPLADLRAEMAAMRTEVLNMNSQLRQALSEKEAAEARAEKAEETAKKAQAAFNSTRKKSPSVAAANADADRSAPEVQTAKQLNTESAGFSSFFKTNGTALGEGSWSRSSD